MENFLKDFKKTADKMGYEEGNLPPPRYWFSTGNYVLNRILSGNFNRGIPQGRITAYVGASGTGKSFLVCNAMREAQKDGAIIIVLDSENALDGGFVSDIGVDVDDENYLYYSVTTISDVYSLVGKFTEGYKKQYGVKNEEAPKVLIVIDSLDMLMTDSELENFKKGVAKGDQGQQNKQLKKMLKDFVQAIKHHNISMIVTSGVYKNQDLLNGEGIWIVKDAIKYALSHIALLSRKKLKDKNDSQNIIGIQLIVEGYKTRFTKPYQKITIDVPYDSGIDPYSGLAEAAVSLGILEKKGGYYRLAGEEKSWYMKDRWDEYKDKVLELCSQKVGELDIMDAEVDASDDDTSMRKKRQEKFEELSSIANE